MRHAHKIYLQPKLVTGILSDSGRHTFRRSSSYYESNKRVSHSSAIKKYTDVDIPADFLISSSPSYLFRAPRNPTSSKFLTLSCFTKSNLTFVSLGKNIQKYLCNKVPPVHSFAPPTPSQDAHTHHPRSNAPPRRRRRDRPKTQRRAPRGARRDRHSLLPGEQGHRPQLRARADHHPWQNPRLAHQRQHHRAELQRLRLPGQRLHGHHRQPVHVQQLQQRRRPHQPGLHRHHRLPGRRRHRHALGRDRHRRLPAGLHHHRRHLHGRPDARRRHADGPRDHVPVCHGHLRA